MHKMMAHTLLKQASVDISKYSGVVCRYHLDGRGGAFSEHGETGGKDAEKGIEWVHFRSDDPSSVKWMEDSNLDPRIIEVLTADETRPRMQRLADGVLINLRGVNSNPGADPEDMVSIRVWFNKSIILTARKKDRRLLSIDDVRQRIEDATGPTSSAEFIIMLTEYLANRIGDVVDSIDDELTKAETELDDDNIKQVKQKLSIIRKQAAVIRRYLAPQREALVELYRSRDILSEHESYSLQHQTDRITHSVEELDLARERALVLHADLQNHIAEQQNSRMYVLSIVATIFLPLSFLTGVFGMNVAGLPGLEYPDAFRILTLAMIAFAAGIVIYMWWKKWL